MFTLQVLRAPCSENCRQLEADCMYSNKVIRSSLEYRYLAGIHVHLLALHQGGALLLECKRKWI